MSSSESIYQKLLNAGELFHYARKFVDHTFMIVFENLEDFKKLSEDLKVLRSAGINAVIVFRNSKIDIKGLEAFCSFNQEFTLHIDYQDSTFEKLVKKHQFEVLVLSENIQDSDQFIINLAKTLNVEKIVFSGIFEAIVEGKKTKNYFSAEQVQSFSNVSPALKRYVGDLIPGHNIVLINSEVGELYKEIFTHLGSGTLIAEDYQVVFEKAVASQVSEIYYLILSYVVEGSILSVTQEEILNEIDCYYVLTIDRTVVGVVRLKEFENAIEVGKLCTLPRYRKMGIARKLIQNVIEIQKESGKDYLFALSNNQYVIDLFKSLDFKQVERKSLPTEWLSNYDLKRDSTACKYQL